MADTTLTIQIPAELKDVIVNVINQICSLRKDKNNNYNDDDEREKKEEVKEERTEKIPSPPSREEVQEYIRQRQSSVNPNRFYSWMEEHRWHDAKGNPVIDCWKQKIEDWESYGVERKKPTNPVVITAPKETGSDDLAVLERLLGNK